MKNYEKDTFTLALELLYGCGHSCSGCLANKGNKRIPTDSEFDFLYELSSFVKNKYRMHEIELAPTDFMTSINIKEVCENKKLIKLFELYDNVELNTTLLYPKREQYQLMAEYINNLKDNGGLGLIVPFEIKHIRNNKYLDTFRKHIDWLTQSIGREIKEFEISLTVGFDSILAFNYQRNTEKLFELYDDFMRLDLHPDASFHFNISNTRDFLKDNNQIKEVKKVLQTLNKLYKKDLELNPEGLRKDHETYRGHINPLLKLFSYSGSEIFWSDGKLYHVPAVYKNLEIESDDFLFKGPINEYFDEVDEMSFKSISIASEIEDCVTCPHILTCGQKHTHILMNSMGINKCIYSEKL